MQVRTFASGSVVGVAVLAIVAFTGLTSASATSGTMTILVDTVLTEDHDGRIIMGADNVTLDCAGHTITGPGRLAGLPGVDVFQRTGVTVKNCVLRDFNDAFRIGESDGNTFTDNSMSTLRQGFTVNQSNDNIFEGNTVADANDFFGFSLASSHGNTLTDNTVMDSEHGFLLINSDNNVLKNNTALRNKIGVGGRVGGNGFDIKDSDGNVLVGNVADDNLKGFIVWIGSTGNDLSGNSASRNDEWGFIDQTTGGSGDTGTDNTYSSNVCLRNELGGSDPTGLCDESGTFSDDDGNTFEFDIEWLASEGITKGCNAEARLFCPDDFVTRGQMAAFLVRALGYTDNGGGDRFVDDDGHTFENDIDKLATAGVTKGCNPPVNDRFCPDALVTRGAMAAFLVRALAYADNGEGNLFIDDDGSVFENDIDKLATAGVTKGCNPPVNDRFCPDDFVTRGQMAAFLKRALG